MVTLVEKKSVVTSYVVELTQQELDVIVAVLGGIGGVNGELRGVMDQVYFSLSGESSKYEYSDMFTDKTSVVPTFKFNKG